MKKQLYKVYKKLNVKICCGSNSKYTNKLHSNYHLLTTTSRKCSQKYTDDHYILAHQFFIIL